MENFLNNEIMQDLEKSYLQYLDSQSYEIERQMEAEIMDRINKKFNLDLKTNSEFADFASKYMRAFPISNGYRYFVNDNPFMEILTYSFLDFPNGKSEIKQQFVFL